jgi:putative hemolysin
MQLTIVLLLILLNGIFAMSEMSLVSAKKSRLQQLADKGSLGALKALALQENPAYFFSAVQVGITTISILSGIIGEKSLIEPTQLMLISMGMVAETAKTVSNVGVIFFLTFLSVIFGEIIPKRIGLVLPEKMAATLSIPMSWISKIGFPIVWVLTTCSEYIMCLLRLNKVQQMPVSNAEIKEMMEVGSEAGVFHESEQQIVANVLHMDEKKAVSIMTHRGDLFYIDVTDKFEDNIQKIVNNHYSRLLVVDQMVDKVIGILHVTRILDLIHKNEVFDFKQYMEEPLYLPETVSTTQVLESFKRKKTEVAIIVNEYGENIGIVTLVDIMASIVGDVINDEEEGDEEIQIREDGSYLVDGLISLDKFSQYFDIEEIHSSESINTLAGLIMEKSGIIPKTGFKIELTYKSCVLKIEVIDMDNNCMDKVLMYKIPVELPISNY